LGRLAGVVVALRVAPSCLGGRLLQQAVATDPHPYNEFVIASSLDPYIWD
jgi:hypothetical protein